MSSHPPRAEVADIAERYNDSSYLQRNAGRDPKDSGWKAGQTSRGTAIAHSGLAPRLLLPHPSPLLSKTPWAGSLLVAER